MFYTEHTIFSGTNLHCPKCSNDISTIVKSVSVETVLSDKRSVKCRWPGCDWEGKYCDLVPEWRERCKQEEISRRNSNA